jgi:hypothetical protein
VRDAGSGWDARFRLTWQQAVGRGLWLGTVGGFVVLTSVAGVALVGAAVGRAAGPSAVGWLVLVFGPPAVGVLLGVVVGRRVGTDVDAGGIVPVPWGDDRQDWDRVVDLRAERRRTRTVVSVYLDSGLVVELRAPYDGELLAADPQFERKLFALAHLWRSHRIGGSLG